MEHSRPPVSNPQRRVRSLTGARNAYFWAHLTSPEKPQKHENKEKVRGIASREVQIREATLPGTVIIPPRDLVRRIGTRAGRYDGQQLQLLRPRNQRPWIEADVDFNQHVGETSLITL